MVAGSLVATGVAVGLAELYSEIVGSETRTRHRVERAQLRHFSVDAAAVFAGVSFPALFFLVAALDWLQLDTAFVLAKWTGVGLIGGYGYAAGRLSGERKLASLLQAAGVALIGAVLIGVKALIH